LLNIQFDVFILVQAVMGRHLPMDFALETVETTGRRVEFQQRGLRTTVETPTKTEFCFIHWDFVAKSVGIQSWQVILFGQSKYEIARF